MDALFFYVTESRELPLDVIELRSRCPPRIASASPGPDSCRGSAFPRPDNNHATPPSPGIAMCPAAGSGSLNRAPPEIRSIAPAGSFCPSASPHLAVSALPDFLFRPSTAVHRESLRALIPATPVALYSTTVDALFFYVTESRELPLDVIELRKYRLRVAR